MLGWLPRWSHMQVGAELGAPPQSPTRTAAVHPDPPTAASWDRTSGLGATAMERTLVLQQGTWTPTDHCLPRSQSSSRAGAQALTTRPASPVTEPAELCCWPPGGHSPQPLSFLSRVTCVMTTQAAGVEGDLGHRSPLLRWPFLRTFFSCVRHWLSPAQGTDWLAQQLSWWPSSEPALSRLSWALYPSCSCLAHSD